MKFFNPAPTVALESFDFQSNEKVGRDLTIVTRDLRTAILHSGENGLNEKEMGAFETLYAEILAKRFKFKYIKFVIPIEFSINAFAITPDINKNNVLVKTYGAWWNRSADGQGLIGIHGDKAVGWVDRSKCTVGGIFQEMPCMVGITLGSLLSDLLTPEEIAALILHEIGHLMSYLEMMAYTFSTCFILMDTVQRLTKATTPVEKIKIIDGIKRVTDVTISNPDIIVDADTKTQIVSIYSDIINHSNTQFGSKAYDMRSWESLSDQFAARMGMTRELATGIGKMEKVFNKKFFRKGFLFWLTEIITTVVLAITAIVNLPLGLVLTFSTLMLMTTSPFEDEIYDRPRERITRIRNEIFAQMKLPGLSAELRNKLNKDLEIIDAVLVDVNNNESVHEKIFLFLNKATRDQKKRRLILQDLESLSNNELFGSFNLLKTLR